MGAKHKATALAAAGSRLTIVERDTPEPGPARFWPSAAPGLLCRSRRRLGGVVAKVGPGATDAPGVGSRVLAAAPSYYHDGPTNYGATQEYTLTRAERVTALPDNMTFEEDAVLPLATLTALSAYTTLGIPLTTRYRPEEKQAILVWGGSSSVGSLTVQTAKVLGFTVYATAGAKNLEYVKTLSAAAVFDYKATDVVSQVVNKVKEDGTILLTAHVAVPGALQETLDAIKKTKGSKTAKIAHAPVLPDDAPTLEGAEIKFTYPPTDPAEKEKHMRECFRVWIDEALRSGAMVSSPRVEVVPGGLAGVDDALDRLRDGVSATKMVISL